MRKSLILLSLILLFLIPNAMAKPRGFPIGSGMDPLPQTVIDGSFLTYRGLAALVEHIGNNGKPVRRHGVISYRLDPVAVGVPVEVNPVHFGGTSARGEVRIALRGPMQTDSYSSHRTLHVSVTDRQGHTVRAIIQASGPRRNRLVHGALLGDIWEVSLSPRLQAVIPSRAEMRALYAEVFHSVLVQLQRLPRIRVR